MHSETLETDFAIVGAGIAGASLAWRLAHHPARPRVLLLEREAHPGYHSTGRSAAMFMASSPSPHLAAVITLPDSKSAGTPRPGRRGGRPERDRS